MGATAVRKSERRREEGRMWVFIRPRGGQKCYLLGCNIRRCAKLCPIHRFDGLDQIPFRTDYLGFLGRVFRKNFLQCW